MTLPERDVMGNIVGECQYCGRFDNLTVIGGVVACPADVERAIADATAPVRSAIKLAQMCSPAELLAGELARTASRVRTIAVAAATDDDTIAEDLEAAADHLERATRQLVERAVAPVAASAPTEGAC